MLTDREYDEIELDGLRWRLADVEDPRRQTQRTEAGREYRRRLEDDIRELEERLASEKE